MLNSFNFAIEHGVFHRDQKTSLISLLLKKGKDPLDCSSYRPILLIPCDLKIYAKVFASRMEKVIHSLIKEDQTGFIKGRNASDNMRRLLHILDFADSHPTPCAVFSLDAEKAFDRLEWNYMWAVLQCFGFGEHFVSMIKTVYHSPAASVITGNIISLSFPLQRGTRQGCPLSPLLFCLSLEPLAQAIRKSEVSIKIHDHNHSISLYADDIILYLDHFDVSVSSIIKEFDNFSSLSGYKINWSKSALMPINNVKVNSSIPSFIPIKESFIYLGITIYKNIHKIARDNFNNILGKVKNDIQRWKNLKVSLDWERVWSNLSLTSKNLAHRLIHFKVIHRAYITPYKRFKMKLQSNLNCLICNTASSGTFLHMFWECPVVISLWTHVNLVLSSLLWIDWSVNPSLCLLNDDSGLCISPMQKRMLFAGFTAAKKTIIQNWFTPHMCRKTYWIRSLLQIVTCECATAWVGGAKPSTIDAWQCFLFDIRDCKKEWLVLCFYCPSLSPSLLTGLWDIEYMSVVLYSYILDVMCEKK